MSAPLVRELAEDGYPVAVTCEVLCITRSSYYYAQTQPLPARAVADAELTTAIERVHVNSRGTYGAPRVHAELRLGLGIACGRKHIARLMRQAAPEGGATPVSAATGRHRRRTKTWCVASSPPMPPTGCGSPTFPQALRAGRCPPPSTAPATGGSTAAR